MRKLGVENECGKNRSNKTGVGENGLRWISWFFGNLLLIALVGCQTNLENVSGDSTKAIATLTNPSISNHENAKFRLGEVVSGFIPDTTINSKLILQNSCSLTSFGVDGNSLVLISRIREIPVVIFGNLSKKEYLLAYQYEGNGKNAYSCFEIGFFEDGKTIDPEESTVTGELNFKTESGLSLDMSLEEVIQIKGMNYERTESDGCTIINYSVLDYVSSAFLRQYNMPAYFMEITIRNNSVKKIFFGFDYP